MHDPRVLLVVHAVEDVHFQRNFPHNVEQPLFACAHAVDLLLLLPLLLLLLRVLGGVGVVLVAQHGHQVTTFSSACPGDFF